MSIKPVLYVAALGWLLSACVPTKEMIYLQPEGEASQEVFTYERVSYRLQTNDILDVQIRSMNQDVNAMFGSSNSSRPEHAGRCAEWWRPLLHDGVCGH